MQLDWHGPWLAPHAAHAAAVTAGLQRGLSVAQVLNELSDGQAPVRFVPQSDLPPGQAYEAYIFEHGACPTRDNLHDLFNGLSWLAFPRTKARLNALQAAQIARSGVGDRRGPVRDALTVFDENAAVFLAPPALWQALQARHWQRLFIDLRGLWSQARLVLLVTPCRKSCSNRARPSPPMCTGPADRPDPHLGAAELDAALAADLSADHLAEKPYCPLPILGFQAGICPTSAFLFMMTRRCFGLPPRAAPMGQLDKH